MEPEKAAEIIEFPRATTPEPETKPAPLRDVIGRVLRSHRQEQKRTLSDVAQEAAMSTQYLSEVERGRKEVSSELLATISGAVGLRMVELSRLNTSYARSPPGDPLDNSRNRVLPDDYSSALAGSGRTSRSEATT